MKYNQLSSSYKYDTLAEAMYAREVEHFHYSFDAANFKHLLGVIIDGPYKQEIQNRLASTLEQMAKVDAIYDALVVQITDQKEFDAAVKRATQKRNAPK